MWGEGSDRVNILEEVDPAEASAQLAEAKRYAALRGSTPVSAGSTVPSSTAAAD